MGLTIGCLITALFMTPLLPAETEVVNNSQSVVSGPYLGMTSPGDTAEPFAPEIISIEGTQHCFPAFSPDGREVFWGEVATPRDRKIMHMREIDGRWTDAAVASFSGAAIDQTPMFSPDGKRLYFSSNRPGGHGGMDLWYVERTDNGWGEPVNLGAPPNSDRSESQPTVTRNGTLYFVSRIDSVQWNLGIYRSRLVDGAYTAREVLDSTINTKDADYTPFIAPDESYLLFASTRPGATSVETDIFVSFRREDGSWDTPLHIGPEINNGHSARFPCVSGDGQYIFFNRFHESGTDAFYWIDAGIIEKYRSAK